MADHDIDTGAGYRGPLVCKIVGITYRQLDYWARTDLVRPSVCDANGSGTQRLYSYRDLVELKVIKRLLDADISLQAARRRSNTYASSSAPTSRPRISFLTAARPCSCRPAIRSSTSCATDRAC